MGYLLKRGVRLSTFEGIAWGRPEISKIVAVQEEMVTGDNCDGRENAMQLDVYLESSESMTLLVSRFGISRLLSVPLSDVLSYPSQKSNAGAWVLTTNSPVEYEVSQ